MTASRSKTVIVSGAQPEWLLNVRGPLIRDLVAANYHVICIGSESNQRVEAGLAELGADYRVIPVKRNQISLVGDIAYCHSVYRLCREIKPDCFFSYTVKPVVFGSIGAYLAGVGTIVALVTGLGSVFTGDTLRHRVLRPLVSLLYAIAFKKCSRIFFQNPDDQNDLGCIVPKKKSFIVRGSGVDIAQFQPTDPVGGAITFLLIARLLVDKGIREYVDAATEIKKKFPAVRFLLAGPEDPSDAALPRSEIDQLESGTVMEYLGPLQDVKPALRDCSVYVLPSYREGTPRTVLEAMACGRAVITTDAPGCRETVVHNDNGLLVPVKDATALAAAMQRLIESPEMILTMGKRGRSHAERKYDVRKVNRFMIDEIEKVMRAGKRA